MNIVKKLEQIETLINEIKEDLLVKPNTSNWEEDLINEVMDNFDFERVKKVMDVLDWKWYSTGAYVPNLDDIKVHAKELLQEAIRLETKIGSGGFEAEYLPDNEPDKLVLRFVLE